MEENTDVNQYIHPQSQLLVVVIDLTVEIPNSRAPPMPSPICSDWSRPTSASVGINLPTSSSLLGARPAAVAVEPVPVVFNARVSTVAVAPVVAGLSVVPRGTVPAATATPPAVAPYTGAARMAWEPPVAPAGANGNGSGPGYHRVDEWGNGGNMQYHQQNHGHSPGRRGRRFKQMAYHERMQALHAIEAAKQQEAFRFLMGEATQFRFQTGVKAPLEYNFRSVQVYESIDIVDQQHQQRFGANQRPPPQPPTIYLKSLEMVITEEMEEEGTRSFAIK
ncbi:hypothetical protein BDR26DRAFT_923970 [Obelidium mucronatum]|nr:hypothetical protein BDR26DRAFT_925045 [Obelidium mucronatum]KAI9327213.1 hypothetical protein BDR26DRAFT_923970 [Obelidium mucronatum]